MKESWLVCTGSLQVHAASQKQFLVDVCYHSVTINQGILVTINQGILATINQGILATIN